ncbi:orotate phosphoribosyltransferase [Kaistia sp. UC242_56]|uniref:orotate phosphoribosyltransferase n=1 Tax=Kaistia sp. UC242_56 TaxID=3374625 RepID=UPI00379F2F73
MNQAEILDVFRESGALLEGHFILSSGLRSPIFLQKARVFMYPDRTERLCKALAEKIRESGVAFDLVVSPALGGLIPGYETARHLGVPAMWVEREQDEFRLRRFELPANAKILVVEDIVSTGLSIRETITAIRAICGDVVAAACLIDRSDGEAEVGVPLISLTRYKVPAYPVDQLPPELAAIPPVKPGSRSLA